VSEVFTKFLLLLLTHLLSYLLFLHSKPFKKMSKAPSPPASPSLVEQANHPGEGNIAELNPPSSEFSPQKLEVIPERLELDPEASARKIHGFSVCRFSFIRFSSHWQRMRTNYLMTSGSWSSCRLFRACCFMHWITQSQRMWCRYSTSPLEHASLTNIYGARLS